MTKRIDGRLSDLENAAGGPAELKIFWQDLDDTNIYHETPKREDAKPWTREEIDELDCNKFRVIRVNYVDYRGPYSPIDDQAGDPVPV